VKGSKSYTTKYPLMTNEPACRRRGWTRAGWAAGHPDPGAARWRNAARTVTTEQTRMRNLRVYKFRGPGDFVPFLTGYSILNTRIKRRTIASCNQLLPVSLSSYGRRVPPEARLPNPHYNTYNPKTT
jgi:hypothetical protein